MQTLTRAEKSQRHGSMVASKLYHGGLFKKQRMSQVVVVYTFNPSTREADPSESLSVRPSWSTKCIPGQSALNKETLSQ